MRRKEMKKVQDDMTREEIYDHHLKGLGIGPDKKKLILIAMQVFMEQELKKQVERKATKSFICTYAWQAQETEGRLEQEHHFICRAADKVEALYKYHVWLAIRKSILSHFLWHSLEDYRHFEAAKGGWGYMAHELAGSDWYDDGQHFEEIYNKYK